MQRWAASGAAPTNQDLCPPLLSRPRQETMHCFPHRPPLPVDRVPPFSVAAAAVEFAADDGGPDAYDWKGPHPQWGYLQEDAQQ